MGEGSDRKAVPKFQWGAVETGGARHLYRENLIVQAVVESLPGGRVLDAGCGSGSLVIRLARHGFKVDGIDLSEESLSLGQKRIEEMGLEDRASLRRGDVTHTDFLDETFDGIVCGEVLEHLAGDVAAVCEFNRILKSGGICVVTVPAKPELWNIDDQWGGHVRRYEETQLRGLFEENCFHIKQLRCWGFPIMRMYRRLVYIPWVKRVARKSPVEQREDPLTKIGLNGRLSHLIAGIFKMDELFEHPRWGIGFMVVAEKM
jgi:ubiquinone/menaquinone biosynthesis C-methylase UbiE